MRFSDLRGILRTNWKQCTLYAALLLGVGLLLGFRLHSLVPGFSPAEVSTLHAGTVHDILEAPVNAPYTLLVHGLSHLQPDSLVWGRAVSAAIGLVTVALFGGLVWYWQGKRNAILGMILFATSAWFLHTARWGTPDVLLFFIVALTACYVWLQRTSSSWALLVGFVLVALSLYIPGMIWFVIAGVAWRWRLVDDACKKNLWAVTAGGVLLLALATPLGLAIHRHPDIIKAVAGMPLTGWPNPFDVLHNLAAIPVHLFIHGPIAPERWLGDVPVLDVFTAAMFLLGGYVYLRHLKLKRVQLTVAVIILGAALVSLGGGVSLTLIMPFIYIVAVAGIGFMIDRWLEVFPRNSLAQGAGYILVGLAMLSASVFALAHYYTAWPEAKATRMVYTKHQL